MKAKVLFILSSYNVFGGTPKKTLDLMKHFGEQSVLYVYNSKHPEFKEKFTKTGGTIYEGFHGKNIIKHIKKLLYIVDKEQVNIINTQFSWGEILGYFTKLFRPSIKLVIAFVGTFDTSFVKKTVLNLIYKKADAFIYISNYVFERKIEQHRILKYKKGKIIYNGTKKRLDNGSEIPSLNAPSLLTVSSLLKLKNIQVVINAMNILVNEEGRSDINYYIVGEGGAKYKPELRKLINKYNLSSNIFLLGVQENIGRLLQQTNLFLHPSYNEGFGIAVAEAMHAAKPIIVSNAGALPELIYHKKNGIVVDPHDPEQWADSIKFLIENPKYGISLGENARKNAQIKFSVERFVNNYQEFYKSLLK